MVFHGKQVSHRQKLTPVVEKALEEWCKQLDDWGFPPRVDLLYAMGLESH